MATPFCRFSFPNRQIDSLRFWLALYQKELPGSAEDWEGTPEARRLHPFARQTFYSAMKLRILIQASMIYG
jgi:hypothetical protein